MLSEQQQFRRIANNLDRNKKWWKEGSEREEREVSRSLFSCESQHICTGGKNKISIFSS